MAVSLDAVPFLPDGESFHDSLYCEKCQCFLWEPCWQHAVFVQDGYSLPLAFASLPDGLAFDYGLPQQNVGPSPEKGTVPTVVGRSAIRPQTVFGPFIAPVCDAGAEHSRTFSSTDGQSVTFDVVNDRWCNWMKLVRTADHGQHNLRVFIREHKVLFVAVKVILPGEELTLALPKHNRKEMHLSHVDYVAVPMDCASSGIDVDEDSMVKCEDHDDALANVETIPVSIPVDFPAACFSTDTRALVPDDQAELLLPQSQPLVSAQSPEHLPNDSRFVASLPVLRSCQREDSPEYPFPSNFCSPTTDSLTKNRIDPGKEKRDEKEPAAAASKETPFSRVYSLRTRNAVRAGAAYSDENLSDDNDEDFFLSEDSGSSSIDSESEYYSEVEVNVENATTKKQDRMRGTTDAKEKETPSSGRCRNNTGSVGTKKNLSARKRHARRDAFLETRNRQIRTVIAVNPFQYPAGRQRLQAYCTAANMLALDKVSPGKQTLDGSVLQSIVESRLSTFQLAKRRNRIDAISMPKEYVGLMNQLASLKSHERIDTRSERMRRLNAVAKINPFQFSSRSERSAAWTAVGQAYVADDDGAKKVKFSCIGLQRFVQTHLDDFPNVLDRFNEVTADEYEREYIEVMRVIAQQAGKDYANGAHPLTIHTNVNAVGSDQLNVAADPPKAHPKPRFLENYEPDRRRSYFSYVYRFVCFECSLHFKDEKLLNLHTLQHSDSPEEAADARDCPSCERSFNQLSSLLRHVLDHGVKASQIIHFIPTADPSIMSFACPTAAPMDVLAQSHDAHDTCFMYSCGLKQCGLRFCTEAMADLHQFSHNVPDDYQGDVVCAGCHYVAADARDLLKHISRHGAKTNDRKLCRLCREFVNDMSRHVQNAHKEQYLKYEACLTLPCDQCEKRFRTPAHFTTHKAIVHSRSLPTLGCLVCAEPFPSYTLLHAHIRKEHGTHLTCVVCQKAYSRYDLLYDHSRTHKEIHICDTCGSVFRSKFGLDQHQYTHRSDYSFKCDLCGKTFKRPSNLAQHKMVVHTDKVRKKRKAKREEMRRKGVVSDYKCPRRRMLYDEFPYKCEECRLGWLQLGNLQQHQRKKHSQSDDTVECGTSHPVSASSV
ncbi:zinc finger protein 225-like [Paramacrobiotus metropolitanus]|uniref:zinc finger protein 225-like n=1 Tax=Paramacrobiotus metropolitanus TaxID=2943436 RepID=UPI002445C0FE|nr:zinc finger protein 225-like [Paramacrobiotus metropolitanus]